MMKQYFDNLTAALEKKIAEQRTPRRLFAYETGRLGAEMFSGLTPLAWTGVFVPFELFRALGISGFFIEFIGAMLAGTGQVDKILAAAESSGFSTDGCAYHRAILGAAGAGLLPRPRIVIGATCPCDGGLKSLQHLARNFDAPCFTLQIPFHDSKAEVEYLAAQMRELISFCEDHAGVSFDMDRMREIIRLANKASSIMKQAYVLAQNAPSPAGSRDLKNLQVVLALLSGSEAGVAVAEAFRDEFKLRIEENRPGLPNEKIRLLWVQNRIQFPNELLETLETNFGANVVIDELNYIYYDDLDEDHPLEAMALRLIQHPFNGPLRRRLDILQKLASDYKVHGAINPSHWGCRQNLGARSLIKAALEQSGVPTIHLDVDCVDPRNFALGPILTRLESFMEMVS